MKLFYFDEFEGKIEGKPYTAICGVGIHHLSLIAVKNDFYPALDTMLHGDDAAVKTNVIRQVPTLHGSDLLRDYDDSVKVAAVTLLFDLFVKNDAEFFVVGYVNDFIKVFGTSKASRVGHCLHSTLTAFHRSVGGPFAFLHEADKGAQKEGFTALDRSIGQLHVASQIFSEDNFSIDFKNLVGHFIAGKHDLGCQMADLVGYVFQKKDHPSSQFTKSLSEIYEKYSDKFLLREIITMKKL